MHKIFVQHFLKSIALKAKSATVLGGKIGGKK